MRHTLLSRWQGSLLGSSLGKVFRLEKGEQACIWQEMQEEGIEALAKTGEWTPEFSDKKVSASEMILICLPLLLFFHDQPQELEKQLFTLAKQQNYSASSQSAMIAYATAMIWVLREQLSETSFFKDLEGISGETSYKILQTLQTYLENGETIKQIRRQLLSPCEEIWLALYCFVTTPEELLLTMRRTEKLTAVNPLLFSLVGALSGAHNGVSVIPIPWRCQLRQDKEKWKKKLDPLFATWSGSYEFAKISEPLKQSAIAPINIIQTRKHQSHK
jgi:ADP-ribosylglycohydrolase